MNSKATNDQVRSRYLEQKVISHLQNVTKVKPTLSSIDRHDTIDKSNQRITLSQSRPLVKVGRSIVCESRILTKNILGEKRNTIGTQQQNDYFIINSSFGNQLQPRLGNYYTQHCSQNKSNVSSTTSQATLPLSSKSSTNSSGNQVQYCDVSFGKHSSSAKKLFVSRSKSKIGILRFD